jgi:hypothetical protein
MKERISSLGERWRDPLLTILTGLLIVMMFVIAPLQAIGAFVFTEFGFVFAFVLVAGVFVMSGS